MIQGALLTGVRIGYSLLEEVDRCFSVSNLTMSN
jgi:hypothetical protein